MNYAALLREKEVKILLPLYIYIYIYIYILSLSPYTKMPIDYLQDQISRLNQENGSLKQNLKEARTDVNNAPKVET